MLVPSMNLQEVSVGVNVPKIKKEKQLVKNRLKRIEESKL